MQARAWAGWFVVLAVLACLFVPVIFKVQKLKHESAGLDFEIQRLSTRNQTLRNELRLLKDDPVYIEHVARRTFKKAKEGEVIYRIDPPEEAPPR